MYIKELNSTNDILISISQYVSIKRNYDNFQQMNLRISVFSSHFSKLSFIKLSSINNTWEEEFRV